MNELKKLAMILLFIPLELWAQSYPRIDSLRTRLIQSQGIVKQSIVEGKINGTWRDLHRTVPMQSVENLLDTLGNLPPGAIDSTVWTKKWYVENQLATKQEIIGTSAATPATTGVMTVNMTTDIITITPTGNCTFNAAAGGDLGRIVTFVITTSGTTSRTLTWGTNFRKTGTLATGTTSARYFAVTFRYVGVNTWMEISRTAAQT